MHIHVVKQDKEREREKFSAEKNKNRIARIDGSIKGCNVGDKITMSEFHCNSSRKSDFSGIYGNFTLIFRHVLIIK